MVSCRSEATVGNIMLVSMMMMAPHDILVVALVAIMTTGGCFMEDTEAG
jgi:hypothetical protein